jgi:hypothetical protein
MVPILMKWSDQSDPARVIADLPRNLRSAAAAHPQMVVHMTPGMALHLARTIEKGAAAEALDERGDLVAQILGERLDRMRKVEDARIEAARSALRRERWMLWLMLAGSAVLCIAGWAGFIMQMGGA